MRIKYIDSLKGICCLIVCVGHMVSVFFPAVYFGMTYEMHSGHEKLFFETPLNVLINGPSALMCFLLLSGFVIPLGYYGKGKVKILTNRGKGYLRLMPMVLIGCLLGWVVMKLQAVYPYRITDLTYSSNYSEWFNNFEAGRLLSGDGPVADAMINAFIKSARYNAPLGTIKYIWLNGFLLLCLTKYFSQWKYREVLYAILFVFSYYLGCKVQYEYFYFGIMLLGMWLCDYYYSPYHAWRVKKNKYKALIFGIIGIILAAVPKGSPAEGFYHWVCYFKITHYLYWAVGWGCLVIAIENSCFIRKVIESKLFQKLGKISFAIFAVHWPVVISLNCYLMLVFIRHISYTKAVLASMLISLAVIILFSYLVQYVVYEYLFKIEGKIVERLESD